MQESDLIIAKPDGTLVYRKKTFRVALGRGGVREEKREGDGATPVGTFAMREILYRPDRMAAPIAHIPARALTPADGWCDDPSCPDYNRRISLPHSGSHEKLWRDDHIYDLIVVLGHNDAPPIPGKGSAIFLHLARESYTPTDGCLALALPDLLQIVQQMTTETEICVKLD